MSSLPIEPSAGGAAASELLRCTAAAHSPSHDEFRAGDGRLREPWQRFASWLPPVGLAAELDRRAAQVAQQIRADGITHNVYGSGGASARPWSLELLPLIIEPADWAVIERGIVQRARLMDAMLADLYGPQRLLQESLLPPALLFRHPGYLRPLQGVVPPRGLHLYIAAFDIARGPDGHWWVIAQRLQGPSGLGYVLHNRLLISRQFPEAFREMKVQHLASGYRRLLDTVEAMAAEVARGEQPRVALLTPGPLNETYFEHAYLARYLGLPLAEGGDFTVRGDRLFLKTVEGLEPVHAVVRRVDDDYCDPLELRPDSALGVPGLLQAVRAGNVVMANALGSGFLESPALQGFLPAIAQRLLGEPLAMPSVPTWWCGEQAAWHAVRDDMEGKVWRHTFPRTGAPPAAKPTRAADVEADPDAWTLQGRVHFSRTPLWSEGAIAPRPALLRVYAVADPQGRWHLLPGGMTRVAGSDSAGMSMQHGGSSLDTWVLTEGAVDTFSMLPQRLSVADIARRRRPVSSHTAENLYWLGRYTERTEFLLRLARATLRLIDADIEAPAPVLEALTALAVDSGLTRSGTPNLARSPQLFERAVLMSLADPQATSIVFNLRAMARTAGSLRDRLSTEHWGLVRSMGERFAFDASVPSTGEVLAALDRLAIQLAAVTGAQSDRMTRDHGWRLLTVGRFVERLVGETRQLAVLLAGEALVHPAGVELLLDLFDSAITFRARYQSHQDPLALTDLLVLDESNPRALACVLRRLRTEVRKLPGVAHDDLLAGFPEHGVGLALETLDGLPDLALRERLTALTRQLADAGARLSDDIGRRFFSHVDGVQRV